MSSFPISRENASRPAASWRRSVAPPRDGLAGGPHGQPAAQAAGSMGRLRCELPAPSTPGGLEPLHGYIASDTSHARAVGRHALRARRTQPPTLLDLRSATSAISRRRTTHPRADRTACMKCPRFSSRTHHSETESLAEPTLAISSVPNQPRERLAPSSVMA
jgi:hypothetical protein